MVGGSGSEEREATVGALRRRLAAHPQVRLAALFGSAAAGALRPGSDLDLAVRLETPPAGWGLAALAADLGAATGRRVDLVLLAEARSALLRREIARGLLVVGDPEEWVELRRRAFREWREVAPRFRRCAAALVRGLGGPGSPAR
jgi:predicted nucleotidyltransferase